jgi:purine-nucleoside phosphorylase
MSEQRERIQQSLNFLKKSLPAGFSPGTAVIVDKGIKLPEGYGAACEFNYNTIPPFHENELFHDRGIISCGTHAGSDIIILKGRLNYYDGISMRDIGHIIYLLKYLGVKRILAIDETASLHPRYKAGELALVYDHINLTGDNPLIGKNDPELGVRFPDMSNAYDREQYSRIFSVMQDKKLKINESVYVSVIGPGSETEAEAHFYREIGADVVGYSIVAENIAAVHAGIKFSAIGLITRELIADRMREDTRTYEELEEERKKSKEKAENELAKVFGDIINSLQ